MTFKSWHRVVVAAALVASVAVLASVHQAEARSNGGGSRATMGSTKSNTATMGSTRSNTAIGSKSIGKLHCQGSGCRRFGDKVQTTGTNKAEPNPTSRDHRQPNSAPGGGVTVTSNGPPRPKGGICAGWGCPEPRKPNTSTVPRDHRAPWQPR